MLEQIRADNVLWNKKKIMNIRRKMKRIYERLEEGGIEHFSFTYILGTKCLVLNLYLYVFTH